MFSTANDNVYEWEGGKEGRKASKQGGKVSYEAKERGRTGGKVEGSNPVRSKRQICESFSESKRCADSLSVYTHA